MKLFFTLALAMMAHAAQAQHVLYIGDSHSYISTLTPAEPNRRFGNLLIDELQKTAQSITYYAACGSAPQGWVRGASTQCGFTVFDQNVFRSVTESKFPSFQEIYRPLEHTNILINLGDNMFDWKVVAGKRHAQLKADSLKPKMQDFIGLLTQTKAKCIWIGPTYHEAGSIYIKDDLIVDELYAQLAQNLAGVCELIDSRPFVTKGHAGDGLHHSSADSRKWAEGVIQALSL